jgi:F-type H+-transporting ATPase subunit gamma
MELVSASKLRRAQEQAQASRAYREAAYELLARLDSMDEIEEEILSHEIAEQPLFMKRPVETRLYVVITSNSGMAGAYNANVLKSLTQHVQRDQAEGVKSLVVTIGNRGAQFVRRTAGMELVAHYPAFGDKPTQADIQPLLNTITGLYADATTDEVEVLYTVHRSGIVQEAVSMSLLPAKVERSQDMRKPQVHMNFEPDVATVIHHIAIRLIEVQIWQALLESLASEHTMRMMAMKNATDNASDLIGDYTMAYNTARQAAITQELAEITGGAEALKG